MSFTPSRRKKSHSSKARPARKVTRALPPGIERDTLLLPYAIAESVVMEPSEFLQTCTSVPEENLDCLTTKADRAATCAGEVAASGGVQVRGRGDAGDDTLHIFMHHWLSALPFRGHRVPFRYLLRQLRCRSPDAWPSGAQVIKPLTAPASLQAPPLLPATPDR